jgi:hypothetical protein
LLMLSALPARRGDIAEQKRDSNVNGVCQVT